MKMAKPSRRDLDAGMDLLGILNTIDGRFGGPRLTGCGPQSLDDLEDDFDCDDAGHQQALYNSLARLLRTAPGFAGRVIFGMCGVICYEKNLFLDPAQDVLAMHPDVLAGLELLRQQRANFLPKLEREARAAVRQTIDRAAARHLAEMGIAA